MFYRSLVFRSKKKTTAQSQGGFGLIELMVSISIVLIVTTIVMSRQDAFNGAILLRSEAYEIALQIREVQVEAVSSVGEAGDFRKEMGVFFDSSDGNDRYYKKYHDANNDSYYSFNEEYGVQGKLDSRFEIREIRTVDGSGTEAQVSEISIVFARPNYDAVFYDGSNSQVNVSAVEIDVARRNLSGTGPEVVRTIEVTSTGQIAVQ